MTTKYDCDMLSQGVSPELSKKIPAVIDECKKNGLDPFPLVIEEYSADEIAELAAYGGFPVRYPHFSFGQQYEQIYHQYITGQGKIYEMVVNNNPTYMYLQRNNPIVDNITVVAHALAHSDFFKNNIMFKHTNRNMMNVMASHGEKIRKYMSMYGKEKVLNFLNSCLSIDDLVDPALVWKGSKWKKPKVRFDFQEKVERDSFTPIPTEDYMDGMINTDEEKVRQYKKSENKKKLKEMKFPEEKDRDVLMYILNYCRLEQWQQNILSFVRKESLYFQPQGMTKVLNEGWASYWDEFIMMECGFAGDEGAFDYAKHHAGVLGGKYNMSNPYKLGNYLLKDIEDRWDKGKFGMEWELCKDQTKKRTWDTGLNKGREKIFEVREYYNDVSFINEFFTKEFCHKHKFFEYELDRKTNRYYVSSKDYTSIKKKLLDRHINFGRPVIFMENMKFNQNEILLYHEFDGRPLDVKYTAATLRSLYMVTKKPVNIRSIAVSVRTKIGGGTTVIKDPVRYRFDGKEYSENVGVHY